MAKAGKRGNGEGSVYQRGDTGKWVASFTYTDPKTGQRKRSESTGATRREAVDKRKARLARIERDQPIKDARIALGDYAVNQWAAVTLDVAPVKPTTRDTYTTLARKHLAARSIGAIGLDRLASPDVERLLGEMRDEGLSDSTVRQVYTVLHKVLATAERDGLVARNVAAAVGRPQVARKEQRYLTSAEVGDMLSAAKGRRYARVLEFIAATGVRRGEALALRWEDVQMSADASAGKARIAGTLSRVGKALVVTDPKSDRSRRTVALPGVALQVLAEEKVAQDAERATAGPEWEETGFVFTTAFGRPVEPRNVLRLMTTAAKAAGLGEGVNVHTLRHSASAELLSAGIPMVEVSRILGHSSITITDSFYGHIHPEGQAEAMEVLGRVRARRS
ncbi:site-specific integrase [Demequina sp. SYSU T00192]|uniref:Site-specific integrase n=1 Tax=Demequina litoralis TaxID=3051660 RepID=A0ABT8G5D7_9MICO|nr:site-specific integrase [Demequina sp. SYSU T00192]MDN4474338.1 site-specific integrase [Demequina sp. SYSU T00192]